MNKCLLTLLFLLSVQVSKGQEQSANSLEFSPQVSLSTFSVGRYKLTGRAYGGEVIYHFNTEQKQTPWMRLLNLKSLDLAFNYKNMGNVEVAGDSATSVFGDTYAVLAGLNIPVAKVGRTELLFSPAFGLGYAGETYFTNQNPVIGGHINFSSRANLKLSTALTATTRISAGLEILHFSNGAFRVPNNGLNAASVSLGIIQSLNSAGKKADTVLHDQFSYHRHSFDIGANIGRRGVYQSKDGYFRTGLYVGYNYRLNAILALGTGVDAVYYHSVFNPADFDRTYQSYATSYEHWRVGAAIGPDLWMGNLAVMVKYGYYLHYNSYREVDTYWTAGLKYKILDHLAAQAKIYVHHTEADYAGFGLMFTL